MAVGVPAARQDIDLHIARAGRFPAKLDKGAVEIRTAFATDKSRMKNADRLTVQTPELFAQQALVLPDSLEQPFGRGFVPLAQERHGAGFPAPLGVEVVRKRQHLARAFARIRTRSQDVFLSLEFRGRQAKIERI